MMKRRKLEWSELEEHAVRAYFQVLRAEGFPFALPSAIETSRTRPNGERRLYNRHWVQEVGCVIKVSCSEALGGRVEMVMLGHRWLGSGMIWWHVERLWYHDGGSYKTNYRYDHPHDIHDPSWQARPRERDLCRVAPDGRLERVAA